MRALPLLALAALLPACAHEPELTPAPEARTLQEDPEKALDRAAGVRIVVDTGAWIGGSSVPAFVLPVKVRIVNGSQRALRLGYDAFTLTTGGGVQLAALPPWRLPEPAPPQQVPVAPGFAYDGFQVAPPYGALYPGVSPWAGPFVFDPLYYDRYYGSWPSQTPMAEVQARAIPEGVLRPGGSVEGFLYFQEPGRDVAGVRFQARLVDAESGERFGELEIPLTVDGQAPVSRYQPSP